VTLYDREPMSNYKDEIVAEKTYSITLIDYIFRIIKVLMEVYIIATFAEMSKEFLDIKLS
jgi:hypothetical protein